MHIGRSLRTIGIDPRVTVNSIKGLSTYRKNRREFLRQAQTVESDWHIGSPWPCPADRYDQSGVAAGQYFHQDLYVAQQVFRARPTRHVDVGSRVDGFVAHVASFLPVEVLDIRPLTTTASNITFRQRDLMHSDHASDNTVESLSCLHTLEHFGLGRYGDPVDFHGYLKGWDSLTRMVAPQGRFYFSVPISCRPRIEFDAHRLFAVPHLLEMIDPIFEVETAAVVDDAGDLRRDVDVRSGGAARTFDISYGCIIFVLRKRTPTEVA